MFVHEGILLVENDDDKNRLSDNLTSAIKRKMEIRVIFNKLPVIAYFYSIPLERKNSISWRANVSPMDIIFFSRVSRSSLILQMVIIEARPSGQYSLFNLAILLP